MDNDSIESAFAFLKDAPVVLGLFFLISLVLIVKILQPVLQEWVGRRTRPPTEILAEQQIELHKQILELTKKMGQAQDGQLEAGEKTVLQFADNLTRFDRTVELLEAILAVAERILAVGERIAVAVESIKSHSDEADKTGRKRGLF